MNGGSEETEMKLLNHTQTIETTQTQTQKLDEVALKE